MKIARTELPFAATSMFLFLVSEKGTEKADLGGLPPKYPRGCRPLPVRIAMAAPWAIRRRGRDPQAD